MKRILERICTPRVAVSGGLLAVISLLIIGLQNRFDPWAESHLDGVAWIFRGIYDGACIVGLWVVWPAIIAAVIGKSPVEPKEPCDPPK